MKFLFGLIAKSYSNFADLISLLSFFHFQLSFLYVSKYLLNQSKTYLKLEILFELDVVFTQKSVVEVQFVVFTSKHGSADPLHRQPAINWIFTQTKLSSTYRRKFLCLDEASSVACNSDGTQTSKIL